MSTCSTYVRIIMYIVHTCYYTASIHASLCKDIEHTYHVLCQHVVHTCYVLCHISTINGYVYDIVTLMPENHVWYRIRPIYTRCMLYSLHASIHAIVQQGPRMV